jgi:MoaA/NifB/PqqE/SkfB family radical SAM enzyme
LSGQISFSWDIHYACNYRCPYCWFNGIWPKLAKQNKYLPLEELIEIWSKVYKNYGAVRILILGGESFIYPNFQELIKELSKIHFVEITSNLSVKLGDLIREMDPSHISITGTFHPLFANFDNFIKNALILKEKGMSDRIWYLAYPPQIKLLQYYKEKFDKYEIPLSVMTFWGEYNGIKYPQGYTQEEKNIFMPYLGNREGEKFQLEPKEVKGKLCHAGQRYAVIKADGLVYRCGENYFRSIGNLFNDDFKLLDEPLACESEFCPCNEWAGLLVNEEKPIEPRKEENDSIRLPSAIETEPAEIKKGIDRSSIPPKRVFLTWDIHYGCNYNCSYCNTPKPWNPPGSWDRNRDKVAYLEANRWLKIWEDIYRRYGSCEIHITGGEPFTYPSFLELIRDLSKMHTLEIITNLCSDVNDIIATVTADRVRIGTTFHPEFADLEEFLKKHLILREHGFDTWANYVAYPPQLDKMAQYKKEFDKLGISFNIQPFMGYFQEREYPMGYTDSELSYLKGCYDNDDIVNKKTVEWKTGSGQKNTKGKPCRMGQMYAKIYPIGDAYRCCANKAEKIGNLIDGTFKLLEEPLPCESEHCFCWRCMIEGEEDNWSQHWVIPRDSRKSVDKLESRYLENKRLNQLEIQQKKIKLDSKLRRLMVILTGRCNINCIMCERKSSNFTLPEKTIEQIVEFFPYLDLIMWQGGEVFMVDYFKEFFQEASRYPQLTQEINTNGLLITEEWAETIARTNTRLIFSIDSTDKNTYEYIRRGAKFETLIRNANLIKEAKQRHNKIDTMDIINIVVMRSNYQHLDSFIDFALQYGFGGLNFMYMNGNICPEENIFSPADRQAQDYLRRCISQIIKRANTLGINVSCDFASSLFNGGPSTLKESISSQRDGLFCLLPWRSLFIDGTQEGNVYPECLCRVPVGNVFKEPLGDIWNSENMQLYRKKIINCDLENWCNSNCINGIVNKEFIQGL